ncbi:MAG: PIN domain-containing protein [Pseudomonadota bacterium]
MKVLIDACVLYPTVLRELVMGLAGTGYFTPLWSARILEEWRRAAARHSDRDNVIAESEIATIKARFPNSLVTVDPGTEQRLILPDPDDIHVLAAAIDGGATALMTLNLKDFPTNTLSAHGVIRRDPDGFLLEAFHSDEVAMRRVTHTVINTAEQHGIDVSNPRSLLKKARLPRLGKALYPRQSSIRL